MQRGVSAAWEAAIRGWETHARAGGAPATTLRTRREHLENLARTIGVADPWEVTGPQLVAWFASREWANETRRGRRVTLLGFWRWAMETRLAIHSPAESLPRVHPSPPRPRPTPDLTYRVTLAGADRRTMLMVRLAAEVGLRRAEVACIHSRDLMEDLDGWSLGSRQGRQRAGATASP